MQIALNPNTVVRQLPPALALGLNRWTARECALAVPAARKEFRK